MHLLYLRKSSKSEHVYYILRVTYMHTIFDTVFSIKSGHNFFFPVDQFVSILRIKKSKTSPEKCNNLVDKIKNYIIRRPCVRPKKSYFMFYVTFDTHCVNSQHYDILYLSVHIRFI